MLEVFEELRSQGKILLLSTHEWGQSLSQLDRLLLLNQCLIAEGSPQQVMTPDNLRQAYGTHFTSPLHPDLESSFFC
jgi:manganese/iron transport system ATP-binding protein